MGMIRGRLLDTKMLWLSLGTVLVALFFWDTPILLPLKVFVVLLHEISHGLAALLTGGSVEQLILLSDQGGLAFTRGGNRFLILSAGYLGSALLGAVLMQLAWSKSGIRRYAIHFIWMALLIILLFYIRDLYTAAYVAGTAVVVFLIGKWGPDMLKIGLLWLVGTFSSLYAVIDIFTDILADGPLAGILLFGGSSGFSNDAQLLASETFIPAFIWGLIWCGLAIAIFLFNVYSLASRR
ncbi:MAG: M50 family metallopeptidase [Ardenticatenaceae bacterium]